MLIFGRQRRLTIIFGIGFWGLASFAYNLLKSDLTNPLYRFLIPDKFRDPPLFVADFIDEIKTYEDLMRKKYLDHIEHVKSIVPEENLLIWNVKDGWSPLCRFLGAREPQDLAVPHENKTGDLAFNAKYTYGNKFTQVVN